MPTSTGKAPDGRGGINEQFVDAEGRAGSRSLSETDQQHAVGEGTAFTFYSTYSASNGHVVWYVRNDGRDLHFDRLRISTAASGLFTVKRQTGGTNTGTIMEGRNMVANKSILDDVTAFGSAEVTTPTGDDITGDDYPTSDPSNLSLDGYLLPKGQAIFVVAATAAIIHVTGFCHFED